MFSFHSLVVVPIGFISYDASVSEDGGIIQLEVGVMEGYLEVEVDVTFTTTQITAEGNII